MPGPSSGVLRDVRRAYTSEQLGTEIGNGCALCRQCGAATTDTAVGTVHAGKFSLDSVIEPVDGWTDEANWNGWACPLFEKDAGMQIVAKWKANGEGWVPPMRPTSTLRVPCA